MPSTAGCRRAAATAASALSQSRRDLEQRRRLETRTGSLQPRPRRTSTPEGKKDRPSLDHNGFNTTTKSTSNIPHKLHTAAGGDDGATRTEPEDRIPKASGQRQRLVDQRQGTEAHQIERPPSTKSQQILAAATEDDNGEGKDL
jgi:hypothetical protein